MASSSNDLLIAIYELRRQSFLIGYLSKPNKFDKALAYAYQNRVSPIFHQTIEREAHSRDVFESIYSTDSVFVDSVTKHIEQKYHQQDLSKISFYKLEEEFGDPKSGFRDIRINLLHALVYTRLSDRFDTSVWHAIMKDAPAEACSLDKIESIDDDIYFS